MSADEGTRDESRGAAADAVRDAFAALPFADKVSTLVRIELDILGDAADAVVSAAEKVADEVVQAFTCCESSDSTKPGAEQPTAS